MAERIRPSADWYRRMILRLPEREYLIGREQAEASEQRVSIKPLANPRDGHNEPVQPDLSAVPSL